MERENLQKALCECGLDEKEALLYISLLDLGESTASAVARESGMDRSLSYYILDKLIAKGLVSFKLKNNVKFYSAVDPGKILQDLREKERGFRSALPHLIRLKEQHPEEGVEVNIFKGIKGFRAVLDDMFKTGGEFLVFGEQGQIEKHYPGLYMYYLKTIEKLKIRERVLVREDMKGKIRKSRNTEFHYLEKGVFSPTTTTVYGDKILITIWEKPLFNIVIKSKKVADSYRAYFNHFWKIAKP